MKLSETKANKMYRIVSVLSEVDYIIDLEGILILIIDNYNGKMQFLTNKFTGILHMDREDAEKITVEEHKLN